VASPPTITTHTPLQLLSLAAVPMAPLFGASADPERRRLAHSPGAGCAAAAASQVGASGAVFGFVGLYIADIAINYESMVGA
jgi:hypothetical protein